MSLFTDTQMDHLPEIRQVEKAILHTLGRIKEDPAIGYLCGFGTQTFSLLTEAASAIQDVPVQEIREKYLPRQATDPKAAAWISTSTSMPDDDQTVILFAPAELGVCSGYRDGEVWRDIGGLTIFDEVTHWMPLPEPPAVQ